MPAWQGTSTLIWTCCTMSQGYLRGHGAPAKAWTCPSRMPGGRLLHRGESDPLSYLERDTGAWRVLSAAAAQGLAGSCVDFVLQGCTGMCTELTAPRSSSSQNKPGVSAPRLAVLTARHLHVISGQHSPHSCPPAPHAMRAGDAPSQAGKGPNGSCNTCHLPQASFKTLPQIPCFTITVLPLGKAEGLFPSVQHWAEVR